MGRNVLFVTTDQQRYDSLGCNGGAVARTPVVDQLAATGIRFERSYCQNSVCMPARSTILTGQYPRTHGVIANGIPLPDDAPSVAGALGNAGYRTALIGKAHFEPIWDPKARYAENRLGPAGSTGPYRGFDHVEFAAHGPEGNSHWSLWMQQQHPSFTDGFSPIFSTTPTGDTGGPEMPINPVPRELYHTDWIADRVIAWIDSLDADTDWICWMSFPDPHHPWDPPASERHRIDWRDLDLPGGHPGSDKAIEKILGQKPAHWLAWWNGTTPNADGAPPQLIPAQLTHDQIREVNALVHIENELIDEATGRVLDHLAARGLDADTDVLFTTDHGEFQGDFGLLYKGPYQTDALLRLPLVWRPAPAASIAPAVITDPVGQVDLAATFCSIAGVDVPDWMQGRPLPHTPHEGRERVLSEWDSQLDNGYRMRTIVRDGWLCTAYEPSRHGWGIDPDQILQFYGVNEPFQRIEYDGTEGELYSLEEDPHQWNNRWDDPALASLRADLVADLYDSLPPPRPDELRIRAMA